MGDMIASVHHLHRSARMDATEAITSPSSQAWNEAILKERR